MTLAEALSVALKNHQAGKLAEAENIYRQILAQDPGNADTLHLMGVLLHQTGKSAEGVDFIQRALKSRVDATFLGNLAELLRTTGQIQAGINACNEAIRISPNIAVAHQNLAALLEESGRIQEALAPAQRGAALAPNEAASHRILGAVLVKLGRGQEALAELELAARLNPNDAAIWTQLGLCNELVARFRKAIDCHVRAVNLTPENTGRVYQLGRMLLRCAKPREALNCFDRMIQLGAGGVGVQLERARALELLNRFDEAIAICRAVIAEDPANIPAHSIIANTRIQAGDSEAAEAGLREAMKLTTAADFHQILAVALTRQGRTDEALAEVDRAVALNPNWTEAHFSKALIYWFAGRLLEAWPQFEWRWKHPEMDAWRHETTKPLWDGRPLEGRRILLYAEQGYGDTIQAARYIKMVAERGGDVTLEVQRGLQELLRPLAGVNRIVSRGEPVGEFDTHAPLLSLPGIFKTTLETIPADVPYVHASEEKIAQWKPIIGNADGKLKVGICWTGGPNQRENHQRSTQLSTFGALAAVPGVRFYSLQKGPSAAEANQPPAGLDLVNLDAQIKDFSDTAAIMANLDLIISVDTAVIHLAGAMARPVWSLLGRNLGHNWMLEREDSPWYPTMRLFRQRKLGQWDSVMERVTEELRKFVEVRGT